MYASFRLYRRQPEPKYRNDENVLAGVTAEYRQITTGEGDCGEFVTDLGLVVPCVSLALRERLQAVIVNHGLGKVMMVRECDTDYHVKE